MLVWIVPSLAMFLTRKYNSIWHDLAIFSQKRWKYWGRKTFSWIWGMLTCQCGGSCVAASLYYAWLWQVQTSVQQTTPLAVFWKWRFSQKVVLNMKLVCYPYSEVVCQIFNVEDEVFSNVSVTFFSELGLLRLCFPRKSIPFFNTIKPMTPVTRAQDKRLHSVYFTTPEKTISALSLILGYLTSQL